MKYALACKKPRAIPLWASILLFLCVILLFQSSHATAKDMDDIEARLIDIIKNKKATVGVAVISNGRQILTINNDIHYPLMSVFKFHQALALSKKLATDNIVLSTPIQLHRSEILDNTYSPLREKHPKGNITLSIYELLKYSLQLSDNNACDIIFNRFVTPDQTDSYIRSLGINDFSISKTEKDMHENLDNCYKNWSTPLAAAQLVDKFLTTDIVASPYHNAIKSMMINCKTGSDRLRKYLPTDRIIIGNKTGSGDRNAKGEIIALNDIAFVLLPDNSRYTVTVFVKDSMESAQDTSQIIADISRVIFSYLTGSQLPQRSPSPSPDATK